MDEVTIFRINYFKEHYPKAAERFKQLDLELEAPDMIMDMTKNWASRGLRSFLPVSLSRKCVTEAAHEKRTRLAVC